MKHTFIHSDRVSNYISYNFSACTLVQTSKFYQVFVLLDQQGIPEVALYYLITETFNQEV